MTIPYEVDTDNQLAALVLTAEQLEVLEAIVGNCSTTCAFSNPLYEAITSIRDDLVVDKAFFPPNQYVLKSIEDGSEIPAFKLEKHT